MAENNGGSDDLKPISVDGVVNGEVRSDREKQAFEKITGDDLRRRAEQIRKRRLAKAQEDASKRKPLFGLGRIAITVLAGAVFIGTTLWISTTSGGFDDKVSANNEQIVTLRNEVNDLKNTAEAMPKKETLASQFDAAASRAQNVADLQNQLAGIITSVDDDVATEQFKAIVDELKPKFTVSAGTTGEFPAAGRWYQPQEVVVGDNNRPTWAPMGAESWEWTVIPTLSMSDTEHVVVMWEARLTGGDRDGALLAWVTADYNINTGVFSSLALAHTYEGHQRIGATTSPSEFGAHGTNAEASAARANGEAGELEGEDIFVDELQRALEIAELNKAQENR